MTKKLLLIFGIILAFTSINAQNNQFLLKSKKEVEPIKFASKKANGYQLKVSFDRLNWKTTKVETGDTYTELWFDKSNTVGEVGTPELPAYKKLILLPYGATITAKVNNYSKREYSFKQIGLNNPIMPVQPSTRKDQDSASVPFQIKKSVYSKQAYIHNSDIVKVEVLGNLRSHTIARITVTPVDYNPSKGNIKVYNDIDIEINITNGSKKKEDLQGLYSPYFDLLSKSMLNASESIFDQHPDLTTYPTKMLVISNRMFENSLKPYIQWKTQKGFNVTVAYTDIIGNTATQIKAYIKQVYDSATPEDPAPTFLVLVGDVDQVPSSRVGTQAKIQTDLYYASVDDDIFPEMYYGRLSATNTQQLDNIINKILYYEKYSFAEPQYLDQVTLIAGVDGTWNSRVLQPTLKYATANYFNPYKGFTTVNEYGVSADPSNPLAQSGYDGCYNPEKIAVGYINYTAHCSQTSWSEPNFSTSSVAGLSNQNKYPLAVANCCQSGDFGYSECLGEALLRSQNKGVVTYIGSADLSYWLEDMYWAVGAYPMVGNNNGYVPTYTETTTGAYDAPFVLNYVTTGAIAFAGNLAVTEVELKDYSRQINSTYYWETYNILGDPSLIPYFTAASANQINHKDSIPVGANSIKIGATKGSYVSVTINSQIIGTAYFNDTEERLIPIQTINEPGKVLLTVTKAQTIPYIDTIQAVIVTGPYITLNSVAINDSQGNSNNAIDFGETIKTNITLKNVGLSAATNTRIRISGQSDFATIASADSVHIGNILAGAGNNQITITDAFTFNIAANVPDQTKAKFTLTFKSDEGLWTSPLTLPINAPKISTSKLEIDDSVIGNNNGAANEDESFYAFVDILNNGHSAVSDLSLIVSIPDSVKNYAILNYEPRLNVNINKNDYYRLTFRFNTKPEINHSQIIPVIINVSSASNSLLNTQIIKTFEIVSGNVIKMNNLPSVACSSIFTDSGGEIGSYKNSENYTKTISSENPYSFLKVTFTDFNLESGYDFLYIYDGPSIGSKKIAGSPFSGTTLPSEIISSGQSLTFRFTSDVETTKSGWRANISCVQPIQKPICASNPTPANNAINVNISKLEWNMVAGAQFYDVYLGTAFDKLTLVTRVNNPYVDVNLERDVTYYWKVIPGNYIGLAEGVCDTWIFKTSPSIGNILMTNGSYIVDSTLFYDSGGATGSYIDFENYTITFSPKIKGNKLKVDFQEFDVESSTSCGFDNLKIYNGPSTTSTLVGTYCGTTLPTSFKSTSANGELTFQFKSDEGITKAGWKAKISSELSETLYSLTVQVRNNGLPINNAVVYVNGLTKVSNNTGNVTFLIPAGQFEYKACANGYNTTSGIENNVGADQTITINLTEQFSSTITVLDNSTNLPISGAKVRVGGYDFFTPPSGIITVFSPSGDVNVLLEKTGYGSVTSSINVTQNGNNFTFKLSTGIYNVNFHLKDTQGNPIPTSLVEINGSSFYTDNNGTSQVQLPYGVYLMKITKQDFVPTSMWVNVKKDSTISIYLDMLLSKLSDVQFNIYGNGPLGVVPLNESNVSIYAGDQLFTQSKTNSTGVTKFQLPNGNYKYTVELEGFDKTPISDFTINSSNLTLKDTLNQQTYALTFEIKHSNSGIAGANVILNGYNSQVTNDQGLAVFSTVGFAKGLSFEVQKEGYEPYFGTSDVTSNKTIEVILTLTDVDKPLTNNLSVYPNPVSDNLFVKSDSQIETIQIISITGSIVIEKQVFSEQIVNIPVNSLSKGTYITRIKLNGGKTIHYKLIKI